MKKVFNILFNANNQFKIRTFDNELFGTNLNFVSLYNPNNTKKMACIIGRSTSRHPVS